LDTAFAAMTQAGANALIVLAEPRLINPQRNRIVDLAAAWEALTKARREWAGPGFPR
jgi:hypothetical protein